MEADRNNNQELEQHQKDSFSLFGKILSVIIILAFLLGGGYFWGKNFNGNIKVPPPKQGEGAPIETLTAAPTVSTINPEASGSAVQKNTQKKVSGGLSDSTVFKPYTISLPSGWVQAKEGDGIASDKLIISHGMYSVSIYQAAFGGGGCRYSEQPPVEFSQNFSNYTEIISTYTYRRGWNKALGNTNSYTVCQKGSDGSFGSISTFGAITAKSPEPADPAAMKEIDAIIASITAR